MKPQPKPRTILQWRAARAKYEHRLRQGSLFAMSYVQKCCGRTIDEATAEIESVLQFHLKEWEQRNPKPAN